MNMIEKVARALCEANAIRPDVPATASPETLVWQLFIPEARAAIEAMREPTSWMLNEAVQIYQDQKGNVAGYEYWQRMVDAALDGSRS